MDSISSLFRINMVTTCSDSVKALCDINSILRNYDLVTDLQRVTFRDLSSNTAHPITQLRLRINDIDEQQQQQQSKTDTNAIHQELLQSVSEESSKYQLTDIVDLDATPWFERWKDKFISAHNSFDHDFIGSNFGVFIIMSTKDLQNFDSIASKLLAKVRNNSMLRFMTNGFIEHYVIVNVIEPTTTPTTSSQQAETGGGQPNNEQQQPAADETNTVPIIYQQAFSRFINCFGTNNCSWLNIPQHQPGHNIVPFLRNFITSSLVPWCERQVRLLNDAISTRKGLRRNLVIATRQLLSIGQTPYANQSVVYTSEAGEMQCRKLGDIAMCLGLYELAGSSYDLAKKEFLNDSAWLYYAGACEAHAAAMYMLNKFQKHHIEKAVATYMDPCKSLVLATRATIIATDILRNISPIDAAKFFVTLTGSDSDLQSALFLEQASRCYLSSKIRLRKASFYYVLAGYRYGRCNLGNLSLRCYAQFNANEWTAATEYVKLSSRHVMDQMGLVASTAAIQISSDSTTATGPPNMSSLGNNTSQPAAVQVNANQSGD